MYRQGRYCPNSQMSVPFIENYAWVDLRIQPEDSNHYRNTLHFGSVYRRKKYQEIHRKRRRVVTKYKNKSVVKKGVFGVSYGRLIYKCVSKHIFAIQTCK